MCSRDVPETFIEKEREILTSRIKNSSALDKAFKGHIAKFHVENCLYDMEWIIPGVDDVEGKSVRAVMDQESKKLNIDSAEFKVKKFIILK